MKEPRKTLGTGRKSKAQKSGSKSSFSVLAGYADLLAEVKSRIYSAQTRAVLSANSEMIALYWDVGRIIEERQKREGWGAAVIPSLARDIRNEFSEVKGFSERNIGRMIAFYRTYPDLSMILPQAVAKLPLESGQGFAFVGRQVHLDVGEEDFYIDLLFYHLKLRCFIVIDIKKGAFKPEYAGKMNFYCSVVDDRLRHATDHPTIGLILCQDKNRIVAEYALRDVKKPIGVSEYKLTRALPDSLKSALPAIEEIERELSSGGAAYEISILFKIQTQRRRMARRGAGALGNQKDSLHRSAQKW